MQLSDLPPAFDDAHVAEALAAARELEPGEPLDHYRFAKLLRSRGSDGTLGQASAQLIAVDAAICGLMLGQPEARRRWGSDLVPAIELVDPPRVSPPPVHEFPDATRPYIRARQEQTGLADLRARYRDFLWLRWKNHRDARGARAAYLDAAKELEHVQESGSVDASLRLQRAAELSFQLNDGVEETASAIREFALRVLAGPPGPPCFLVEAASRLLVRADSGAARALAEAFSARAEAAGAAANRWDERSFRESAAILARELDDKDWAVQLRLDSARSHEREARERMADGALVQSALYREAIAAYAAFGAGEDVQRLKAEYAAASARVSGELRTARVELELTSDQMEALLQVAALNSDDPAALLSLPEEWGFWATRAVLDALHESLQEAAPLLSMIQRTTIEADGRVQPESANAEKAREARRIAVCAQRAQFAVGLVYPALERLRADGRWTVDRCVAAIAAADPDLAASVQPGVSAYQQREWWLALHAIAPQVERGVRIAAARAGAAVTSLTTELGWRWVSITDMLEEPSVREVIGDDLAYCLTAVFDSPHGPNYRNNVAHGALPANSDCLVAATLAPFSILSIARRLRDMDPVSGGGTQAPTIH